MWMAAAGLLSIVIFFFTPKKGSDASVQAQHVASLMIFGLLFAYVVNPLTILIVSTPWKVLGILSIAVYIISALVGVKVLNRISQIVITGYEWICVIYFLFFAIPH